LVVLSDYIAKVRTRRGVAVLAVAMVLLAMIAVLVVVGRDDPGGPGEEAGAGPTNNKSAAPARAGQCGEVPGQPAERPDGSNTGVPVGTELAQSSGDVTIDDNGAVLDGRDIHGTVVIEADNVTVRNSRIHPDSTAESKGVVLTGTHRGLRILDNEIFTDGEDGYIGIDASNAVVCGNHIHGFANGMTVGAGMTIQANYVHGLFAKTRGDDVPHYDGIEIYYGGGSTVIGNTLLVNSPTGDWWPDTNAVNLTAETIDIKDVVVRGNWLGGGSYTIGVRHRNGFDFERITVDGNRLVRDSALYGPLDTDGPVTETANVWDDDGKPIDH
jgi:hypothetical protein